MSLPHRVVVKMDLLTYVKMLAQCPALDKHHKNVCYDWYSSNIAPGVKKNKATGHTGDLLQVSGNIIRYLTLT